MTDAHNVTSLPKRPLKDRAKQKFQDNKEKLTVAAAAVLALSTSYYAGKSKGKKTFNLDLYVTPPPGQPGEPRHVDRLENIPQEK